MDTEKLKAWLAAKGLELSEDELAALTSIEQVRALAGERGIEVSEDELAELEPAEASIDEEAETEEAVAEDAKVEEPVAEEAAKVEEPVAEEAKVEEAAPIEEAKVEAPMASPELDAAHARIAALEAELGAALVSLQGYQQREVEAAEALARAAAEGVLMAARVKPKFLKTVTRELEGQDLTSDAGKAALDALLAEFPEYVEPPEEFPADLNQPPPPGPKAPAASHKAWVRD